MKPQRQGFNLNRSSTSRESESTSVWGWWEEMITQTSHQNKKHGEKYITADERTLLERQSSVVRAQYDIAKHELLSNSSINVIQKFDRKLRNSGKYNGKPRIIQGNITLINESDKGESKMLNECFSYCNLASAHVDELTKGQRHRSGVAHNMSECIGRVELSSRYVIPRHKVDKRKTGRSDRLKAKLVSSETMTSNLSDEIHTMMVNLCPEKAKLMRDSTIIDKMELKSKKIVKKQQQNTEQTKLLLRENNLELKAIEYVSPLPNVLMPERELYNSNYDSWYNWRLDHQEGHQFTSLERIAQQQEHQQKTKTEPEKSKTLLHLQVVSRPPSLVRRYRETVQKPNRKKGKLKYSERKERREAVRCIALSQTKSVDSAENSTLREEYTNYSKNNVLRQAAEIKSSLALNIECSDNNSLLWTESTRQTPQHGMEMNQEQIRKEDHVLKRCSCELKLYCEQSESESMIINVLNPTKENTASELLSSFFESNDFITKCNRRKNAGVTTDHNDIASISAIRAISKKAQTHLDIKDDEYISASSNLLVKPAIANFQDVCEKSVICLNLEGSESYECQKAVHLFDKIINANDKVDPRRLYINDSLSTIRNVGRQNRNSVLANNKSPSMINISSLSLVHYQLVRNLPKVEPSVTADIESSSNIFNLNNMSAVSFVLSSVTVTQNIRPPVCRRNRVIIPTSSDFTNYLEMSKTQTTKDSVLKSSSKISLFHSDSIPNILGTKRPNKLLIKNASNSVSCTTNVFLDQPGDVFFYLDSQTQILRSQLLDNIDMTQSKMQTLRISPGKNDLDKNIPRSQFNRSFRTMNVRIPIQDITSPKHTRDKNKYDEEEPRLSVLYQKDLTIRPKYISGFTQRLEPKERAIKSSKSQKHIGSNVKKVKFKKNERTRLSKCTTREKSSILKGFTTLHKQETPPKLVGKNGTKSFAAQFFLDRFPSSSQEAQIKTRSDLDTELFKDILSWPTSYPIASGCKHQKYRQYKEPYLDAIRVSHVNKRLYRNDGVIRNEDETGTPMKTRHIQNPARLWLYKSNLNIDGSLPKLKSEMRTNKSLKSVINKCVKTIKSITTKKASVTANTDMSAANCYSKCKQWEQSCYFCTVSRETPETNGLRTNSKRISNVEYIDLKDDGNFLKRCPGKMYIRKNGKVKDASAAKTAHKQKLGREFIPRLTGQTKIIYLNPASYINRNYDSYAKQSSKNHRPLDTETDNSNFSTVSNNSLCASKSIEFNKISKRRHVVPHKIETIFPLARTNFNKSESEVTLIENNDLKNRNEDKSIILNHQETQFHSVSNKSQPSRTRNEHTVKKVTPVLRKDYDYSIKSSLSSPTNFKRFIIRCSTLFRRNIKTPAKVKVPEVKSKLSENDSKKNHKKPQALKLCPKHVIVQEDDLEKNRSDRHSNESDYIVSRSRHSSKKTKGRLKDQHDKSLKESAQNTVSNSIDVNSLSSNILNNVLIKNGSYPTNYYRKEKIYCGYAHMHSNKVGKKNKVRLLRDSLHKNLALQRLHCLNDKIQPKRFMNIKKTNCQVMKRDVGTNCIWKKKIKRKSKCVQADLCDDDNIIVMPGDRKKDSKTRDRMRSARNKCEEETKQKKCGYNFGTKKDEAKNSLLTEEYIAKVPRDKKEMKITHTITAKCKKFWKINKPQNDKALEEIYPYKYVDCKPKDKDKKNKVKLLELDNASEVKWTQTPLKVKKPKCITAVAKTAVKALQVDSDKLLKVAGKVNQIKFTIKPKELTTLPLKSDGKKNEATNCYNARRKNKYVKTIDEDHFICSKSTSTDNLITAKMPVKRKLVKQTAKVKKSLPCPSPVNKQNDISTYIKKEMKPGAGRAIRLKRQKNTLSAIEALLIHEPAKINDTDSYSRCKTTNSKAKVKTKTARQKKEKSNKKAKVISSFKHFNDKVKDTLSVSAVSTPQKLAVKTFAKQKQKKSAKTKKDLSLNKAVMTQDNFVSSCCTNTTPTIDKEIGINVYAKNKQNKNAAKGKKALLTNKAVETRSLYVSSGSTNTSANCDKKVEVRKRFKKKRDVSAPNTKRALSCPRCPHTPKEKTVTRRKQFHSDSIKGTQTKTKRLAKQKNTALEESFADNYKGRTKIYTTDDKQTSASSKCMPPLTLEAPAKYPTMMNANRTKQICCAFFTAGAWRSSRAAISQKNQAAATNVHKPLQTNLQIMTAHGITCNLEKQRKSRKSKYVNAVTNDKPLKQELKIPLSKSSPCCICGNAICDDCKVNLLNKSIAKGQKGKKLIMFKNKGEGDSKKNNDFKNNTEPIILTDINVKVASKNNQRTTQQGNTGLAKEAKKTKKLNKLMPTYSMKDARTMEKLNKTKYVSSVKEAKKIEKLNKHKHKHMKKEAKRMEKNNKQAKENKRGNILKINYKSVKNDQPQRKVLETKRKVTSLEKNTIGTKKSINDPKAKTIRIPFAFLTRLRTQKRNPTDTECEQLYKSTFRRRIILFIYVRSCFYFVRGLFRRLVGCLLFSLGVIVWTPCICCFECFRECLFCYYTPYR